jgi:hypothetical protein
MNTFRQWIFLFSIAAILLIPGAISIKNVLSHSQLEKSDVENRRLALLKKDDIIQWPPNIDNIEKALNDQVGFRSGAIQFFNRLLINVFSHTSSRRVAIGSGDYWFLMDWTQTGPGGEICDGSYQFNQQKINNLAINIERQFSRWEKQGIEIDFIAVPSKPSVYTEKMPSYIRRSCGKNLNAALRKTVASLNQKRPIISYPLEYARSLKDNDIYYSKSFHWHVGGAQKLLSHIYPALSFSDQQITRTSPPLWDLGRMSGIGKYPYNYTTMKNNYTVKKGSFNDPVLDKHMKANNMILKYDSDNKNNKTAVIISNSFGWSALEVVGQMFETTYLFETNRFTPKNGFSDKILKQIQPDNVIFLMQDYVLLNHNYVNRLIL